MPDNYKYTEVSGESFQRGYRVIIENSLEGPPSVTYVEEKITNLNDGTTLKQDAGLLTKILDNLLESFALVDPLTGNNLGVTGTFLDAYVLIYSAYWHLIEHRDQPTSLYYQLCFTTTNNEASLTVPEA